MSAAPLVSVIIPAHNAAAYIGDALRGAIEQSYPSLEIIVADDGSEDQTREEVVRYQQRGRPVHWVASTTFAGRPAVPRNRAIAMASGVFVAFLDADDRWAPHKIADQIEAFRQQPDLVLIYSVLRAFGPGVRFSRASYGLKPWPFTAAVDPDLLEAANTVPCSSVLARRDLIVALNGFDEDPELSAVEDFDLWLRLSNLGPIGFIPRIHGFYRVHAGGISRDPEVQRRRADYLVRKRNLTRFTFREFRTRGFIHQMARNAADVALSVGLLANEWIARRMNRAVPVWRGPSK